ILDKFYYQNLVSNEKSTELFNDSREQIKSQLARYELADIPLNGKAAAKHQVDSAVRILTVPSSSAGDLQQCNPEYRMKPHR
ncbi:UNVERIFIED_CONTAM: carotenoid oxygenase family protein, partial [Bacteroidetes bacterium 56_B9]